MSGQQLSMEQSEKVQTAGRNLLLYIFSMIKTGEIHDLNNEAWIRPSEKINDVIRELFKYERRRLTFIIHEGTAQLNSHALWLDKNTMETTEEMERMFAMREIGGVMRVEDQPSITISSQLTFNAMASIITIMMRETMVLASALC